MADTRTELRRCHVLDGVDGAPGEAFQPTRASAFQMRRAPDAPRHSLRLDPARAREQRTVLGFDVGQPINAGCGLETLLRGEPRASLRLGPDEWLLIGQPSQLDDQAGLKITDISHRNIAIDVRGEAVRDVLQTGIALDLDERGFPAGAATRTLFVKAEVVLVHWRDAAGGSVFRIECWRSFGRYLAAHLAQSATLLGLDPK